MKCDRNGIDLSRVAVISARDRAHEIDVPENHIPIIANELSLAMLIASGRSAPNLRKISSILSFLKSLWASRNRRCLISGTGETPVPRLAWYTSEPVQRVEQ